MTYAYTDSNRRVKDRGHPELVIVTWEVDDEDGSGEAEIFDRAGRRIAIGSLCIAAIMLDVARAIFLY
ncbi:MAG TPA: hypothetical protein VE735_08225 [Gammaproteobacteria bacterium]|nr:hypothetical protein [Gammaproteobacteria bacterium]